MKKRPILNAYETKLFKEWIADGNAVETEKGVWLEQTTQYRVKFTYEELQNYFKKEYLTYKNGGSAKDLLSSRASKVAKKEKSLNLKAYNVPSVSYAINPLNEGLDEIFQDIVGKDEFREAMSGVDFVGNTATGTDAHKLLHLVGKREGKFKDGNYYLFSTMENEWSKDKILSKEMSVAEYYKQRSLIEQRFPNWIAVVYNNFSHKQEFNLPTLYDVVNSLVVSKLLNKKTNAIIIELNTKDGAYQIGFNAKIFRSVIKSLMMAGITDATGYFRLPYHGVTILDSSLRFPNENKRDEFYEFFTENSFGLVMPIMLPDEETLEETRKTGLEMAEIDNLVYEFPVIRVISPNEYEIEIYGQDTLTYSRGKGIKIGTKSTTKSTPKETPKATPKATPKTTDKKTALGNKLRKGMVVRIEYKESNGSTLSYDLFYDNGDFIEYVLIINKKGEELVEAEEIITEKELNEKYTELSEFIIDEFYETKEDGGELMASGGQMELFVGGGRAVRPSMFEIYQVKDKMGRVAYFTDKDLQKFLNDWNEDYDTDYEDWIEFNEYEREFIIKPIFSKNEMGGYVNFEEKDVPKYLYHATYKPLFKKIKQQGLDTRNVSKKWEDSVSGYVYLAKDPFVAESYAETSENVPESYLDNIIILKIDTSKLDKSKLFIDANVQDNEGDTLEYRGIIPIEAIEIYENNSMEMGGSVNFEETQINDIANWENEEIANYLDLSTKEVANNREKYVRLAQNELMLSGVDSYDNGGGVGEFPPKGELTNKDNFLLKYEKKGGEYEFFVYKPITKEVSGYNQIKHVCLNKDCPQKMTYEQFINYLYAELYLDDTQYADGGSVNSYDNGGGVDIVKKDRYGNDVKIGDAIHIRVLTGRYGQTKDYEGIVTNFDQFGNVELDGQRSVRYTANYKFDDYEHGHHIWVEKINAKDIKENLRVPKKFVPTFSSRDKVYGEDVKFTGTREEFKEFIKNKYPNSVWGQWNPLSNQGWKYNNGKYISPNGEEYDGFSFYESVEQGQGNLYMLMISKKYADGGGVNTYAMGGSMDVIIASSPTLEGIKKLISEYLYGSTITLVQIDDDGEFFEVHNKKGITPFYVKLKNNKYQFVPSQDNFKNGGSLKKKSNDLGEYYEKYSNGGFVGGDIIKFKYDGKDFTRKVESVDEMGNAVVNLMKSEKATINPADIFDIKKEFTEKDVIIKKIGLSEENADFLISLSPTFAVWLADSIIQANMNIIKGTTKEQAIEILNNTPNLLQSLRQRIRGILDWLQHPSTPKQNLRELTFAEAEKKSEEWHEELSTSGGDIDYTEPKENIILKKYAPNEFGITYYWVFIPKSKCNIEGKRMGHCGTTGASSLISLRSVRAYTESSTITDSHVTVAYDLQDGKFYQGKAKKNAKPSQKYFPYIFDLIESLANGEIQKQYELNIEEKLNEIKEYTKKIKEIDEKVSKHIRNGLGFTQNEDVYFGSEKNLLGYEIDEKKYDDKALGKYHKKNILENITRYLDNNAYIQDFGYKYAKLQELQNNVRNNREFEGYELAKEELVEDYFNWYLENISYPYKEWKELRNDRHNARFVMDDYNFDFNGFGCEYKCENDYGWGDMTNKQIKELYESKPELFNDFAGQYMLYKIGLIDEEPNTIVTIEKSVEYVADLLSVDRDLSDDFVEKVLTGDTYEWFDGSDSWSYFYDNAGDYVDDLKKADYDAVLDKIVEITGLDKEIVEENGAKHYLDGDDEEFDAETFEEIKRAIANTLEGAERSSYENYYYDATKEALGELGVIKKLDDTGVEIEVDLKDLIGISAIIGYIKNLNSENLEDVFFEAESNGDFSLPDLSINDRYGGDTDNWQDGFDINNYAVGGSVKYKAPSYKKKIFGVYIFETKNKSFQLEVYLFERENDTEDALEIQNDLRKELGSIIIKNVAWKNLLSGKKVMARSSKNNYVGTLRQVNTFAVGGAVYPDLSMQKPQVVNDSIQLAEFELKQAKELTTINNIKNKQILSSDDAVDIFRQIWEKDTISAYEQAYVLFVNTNNKPKGFYHHSSGAIDGTIMDIQMISGMAVKSLSKGVIIAHNHPSGNIQPSEADKKITEQMKQALQLFNIKLLDSLILTENNYLSFVNMGIL
jgi:DNA repair protein RadC